MAPEVVTGRIASVSTASGELFGRPGWDFTLQLVPWRGGDGPILHAALFVKLEGLEREEAKRIAGRFEAGATVAVEVGNLAQADNGRWSAQFLGSSGAVVDDELAGAESPATPPYIDPELGTFERFRDSDRYDGRVRWLGRPIVLTLDAGPDGLAKAAACAQDMLARDRLWHDECLARVYADLHPVWTASWADGEMPDREGWLARLSVDALEIDADGHFSLWFDDGGLFLGHAICVSGSLEGGAATAQMLG